MTEEDARLALLQTELNTLQSTIRNIDTIMFQIKGWCVTAALAIGGFAVAYHQPALLVVGVGAVIGFYLVNCQFKMVQRIFIKRNEEIDSELKKTGVMQVLRGAGTIEIVGTAYPQWSFAEGSSWQRVKQHMPALVAEATSPNTFSLYLFITVCLAVEIGILA